MANSEGIDAAAIEIWEKDLYADVMDTLYFNENKMMGKDENNIIQLKDGLLKSKGDTITLELTSKLTGNGVTGDEELEGNEEAISAYSESISINLKRFGVRLKGKLTEQKNAYDMREDAKGKLKIKIQEFMERQAFLKLAGVTHTGLYDINGAIYSADCAWSNTPDVCSTTDTGNGYGSRYLCADYTNGLDSLAATDLITPALISRMKIKCNLASPKIRPLRIGGKNYWVMFIHPWQTYDLKQNATYAQAQREAEVRGKENPIFTGALGVWDQVIIHEHEYVPFLDISLAGYNYNAAAAGTIAAVDAFRAIICGQQALGLAKCKYDNGWVEEQFDYKNKTGFATGWMGGVQKIYLNSKNYGCAQLDTAATAQV